MREGTEGPSLREVFLNHGRFCASEITPIVPGENSCDSYEWKEYVIAAISVSRIEKWIKELKSTMSKRNNFDKKKLKRIFWIN